MHTKFASTNFKYWNDFVIFKLVCVMNKAKFIKISSTHKSKKDKGHTNTEDIEKNQQRQV